MKLGDLRIGKVDGKADFSEARSKRPDFRAIFLLPDNVRLEEFDVAERYFITGFRGTGKTSLLRYYLYERQPSPKYRRLILFKSDLDEDYRTNLSIQTGYEFVKIDSNKMEFSQDFKSVWRWFILHKLAELLVENRDISSNPEAVDRFLSLLGLNGKTFVEKVLGVLPRLEGANIKLSGDLTFIKAELSADFSSAGTSGASVPLRAIVAAAVRSLLKVSFKSRVILAFDELEAFYSDQSKFRRDLRMVRDLLFVIDELNQIFVSNALDVLLLGAVRSEVLASMKSDGQEIERTVHDHGVTLSWHATRKSLNHPLIEMIRRRLLASGVTSGNGEDVFFNFFPARVNGLGIDSYLLDGSFYKPRDVVWRLSLVQEAFPNETFFHERFLIGLEGSYSQKLWDEIAYELSATYSPEDVDMIKRLFSGFKKYFSLVDIQNRFFEMSRSGVKFSSFVSRTDLSVLLHNLYRLGAIGNDFAVDGHGKRRANRWMFRNEPDLLIDRQMVIANSLDRALSTLRRG